MQGVTDKGEAFKGQITASVVDGSFEVPSPNGATCHGKYDQFSTEPTIKSYVSCSDGRHGRIIAYRNSSLEGGTGTGEMSDGTNFSFTFGNDVRDETP